MRFGYLGYFVAFDLIEVEDAIELGDERFVETFLGLCLVGLDAGGHRPPARILVQGVEVTVGSHVT